MATACPYMEATQVIDPNSTIHVLSIEDDFEPDRLVRTWLQQAESRKFQVTPAEQSMRSGADHFLVKGNFGPDALVETIVSVVDARRGGSVSVGQPVRCGAGALVSALPMSAKIAGDMSDQLAHCGSWNRYRRASGMQF